MKALDFLINLCTWEEYKRAFNNYSVKGFFLLKKPCCFTSTRSTETLFLHTDLAFYNGYFLHFKKQSGTSDCILKFGSSHQEGLKVGKEAYLDAWVPGQDVKMKCHSFS